MANTGTDFSASGTNILPVPHVKLVPNNDANPNDVTIEHSNNSGNYSLIRFPIVSALDLSEEQIEKGVYVEMAHYRRGKSSYNRNKNEAGYVVPAPQIGGVNPLGNKWTRGGSHIGSADRPNHYKVTSQNEQIPVWEYLKNRHVQRLLPYLNPIGNQVFVNLLVPAQGLSQFGIKPGKTFMYSPKYRPYYFKFRYIMWDEDTNNWISGGWSRVVKLAYDVHPFHVDAQASAIQGKQVGNLSPNFNTNVMKCWFETRLP